MNVGVFFKGYSASIALARLEKLKEVLVLQVVALK